MYQSLGNFVGQHVHKWDAEDKNLIACTVRPKVEQVVTLDASV